MVLVDGVADSGLGLLLDVLTAANLLRDRVDGHIDPFEVSLRATTPRVRTGYGLGAAAEPLEACLEDPPDQLLVPGLGLVGAEEVVGAVRDSAAVSVVRELHERGTAVSAACSGTFVLAEGGVLDGRAATTSWWLGPTFRRRYPGVDLDETRSLVIADTVTTAGAALAHLDLALSLVRRVSPWLSEAVGDYLAVGDRPQQAALVRPSLLPETDPTLAAFDRAVREQLARPLDIGAIAVGLGVSQRTLQRLTATVLGTTPVRYVQQVRLERAVDLLRTTDLSTAAVARAVGYRDATSLITLLRRRHGATPEEIRRRRATSSPA
ncbi:helix-turn-helix domain-containing protein [Phycicoccus sp. CMS6Z-2]|nr:helix-turn-helix domain-containing protein [Phycicoccus flavus]